MDNKNQGNFVEFGDSQLPLPQSDNSGNLVQNSQPESGIGLWENPGVEHRTQDLGNRALFSPEKQSGLSNNPGEERVRTELSKAQALQDVSQSPSLDSNTSHPTTTAAIKTTTTLSPDAVNAIDQAKAEFFQDGDASSFYEKARNYMEENLSNSYNRELGK